MLVNFFDNDPEKVKNKSPHKEHSFRKLCEHPELKMSHTSLWSCVRLLGQDRRFPTVKVLLQLPKAHKILLLPVPADETIETANEISGMTWRDARDWIKQKYQSETSWLRLYTVWNT